LIDKALDYIRLGSRDKPRSFLLSGKRQQERKSAEWVSGG